jgi:hypothetical protein
MESHDGLNAEGIAEIKHFLIVQNFGLIKLALAGLDSCPFNGKTICVESCLGKELYILLISVIMVNCIKAWLKEACGAHLLHCPIIAMYIIAFYLMGGS